MNPTQGALEARLNSLEGGSPPPSASPARWPWLSGQAAETLAILTLAEAGDHVVSQPVAVRRHLQPVPLHAAEARHRGLVRRRPRRPRAVARRRSSPNTKAVLRRGAGQPEERHLRHRGRLQGRPRQRHPADRRQHRPDAVPHPPDRVGRRHRRALRSPSSSAATARRSAGRSSTVARSTSAPAAGSRTSPSRTRATTAWPTGRRSVRARSSSRPACRCCATSAHPSRRSTHSCSSRVSRR